MLPSIRSHCAHSMFRYFAAPSLGIASLSGHRLGAVLTIPILVVGYTSGLKGAFARHLGLISNGEAPLHKGYDAESTVPYFVRHEVSDRRR